MPSNQSRERFRRGGQSEERETERRARNRAESAAAERARASASASAGERRAGFWAQKNPDDSDECRGLKGLNDFSFSLRVVVLTILEHVGSKFLEQR